MDVDFEPHAKTSEGDVTFYAKIARPHASRLRGRQPRQPHRFHSGSLRGPASPRSHLPFFPQMSHEARNVVLLIDGLGDNYLMAPSCGRVSRRRRGAITSVFRHDRIRHHHVQTGRTPLEHGLTGWFTYFAKGYVAARCRFARAATTSRYGKKASPR